MKISTLNIPDNLKVNSEQFQWRGQTLIELRSKTDSMDTLREKMQEYLDNGLRLGWLIDPKNKIVEIYRQGQAVEILHHPTHLSGEDVLLRFVLELEELWK